MPGTPVGVRLMAASDQKTGDASVRQVLNIAVSDFPSYDGSTSPEDFLVQCHRLAGLGGIADESLASIIAARCIGRALAVVNELEDRQGGASVAEITETLLSHFSSRPTPEQAAVQLARLVKGGQTAQEYGQKVGLLVKQACPEFFTGDGHVKNP